MKEIYKYHPLKYFVYVYMSDYLQNQINYYKVQIAKEKQGNQAIDPLNLYSLKSPDFDDLDETQPETENTAPNPRLIYQGSGPYSLASHTLFLQGNQEGLARAYDDPTGAFSHYYLPHAMITEAYKENGNRSEFLGKKGMFDLIHQTPNLAVYKDYTGRHHVAIKGTNNASDLYSDAFILFRGGDTGSIMGPVGQEFSEVISKFPNKKFNIYGHSLGASRASILLDQYPDKINGVIAFNMGKAPLGLVGWKPTAKQEKLLHYSVIGDPISNTVGYSTDYNTVTMRIPGRPPASIIDKINKFHSLSAFTNWSATYSLEQLVKHSSISFGGAQDKGPKRFKRLFQFIKNAERKKPIINNDELDKLASRRSGVRGAIKERSELKREVINMDRYNAIKTASRQQLVKILEGFKVPNVSRYSNNELKYLVYATVADVPNQDLGI
jgi:hypothetical protein